MAPELVAERARLEPKSLSYERAAAHLVLEGALGWEKRLRNVPAIEFYRITERGLDKLGTSWTWFLRQHAKGL